VPEMRLFLRVDRRKVGRKRGVRYSQEIGSTKRLIFSGLEWRRGWDSNSVGAFGICKLQIRQRQHCRECHRCRGALHLIAPDW
jgi:hypothetical protein